MQTAMRSPTHAQPSCPLRDVLRIALSTGASIALVGGLPALIQGHPAGTPWLVGSMGASSLMMAAFPESPYGRPYPVVVGNVLSAIIAMAWLFVPASPVLLAALAVATAVVAMATARALHPPSAGLALMMVLGGTPPGSFGWEFLAVNVFAGSLLLVAVSHAVRFVVAYASNHADRPSRP